MKRNLDSPREERVAKRGRLPVSMQSLWDFMCDTVNAIVPSFFNPAHRNHGVPLDTRIDHIHDVVTRIDANLQQRTRSSPMGDLTRDTNKFKAETAINHLDMFPLQIDAQTKSDSYVPSMSISYNRADIEVSELQGGIIRAGELTSVVGPHFEEVKVRVTSSQYAFVCLFYGTNPHIAAQTLLIGHQLRNHHNSNIDVVLLVLKDTPADYIQMFSTVFSIIKVDTIAPGNASWVRGMGYYNTIRWKNVWCKLWALRLIQYKKVLLLDVDMLIRSDISDLFELPAPSGAMWHKQTKLRPNTKIAREEYVYYDEDKNPFIKYHINAGALLLTPDKATFDNFISWISNDFNVMTPGSMPEQEALTTFFDWFSLNENFNIGFLKSSKHEREDPLELETFMKSARIIHFPGEWSIRNYCRSHLNIPGLPGMPGVKTKGTFDKLFLEWIRALDTMYVDRKIHVYIKTFLAQNLDAREPPAQTRDGPFSSTDKNGLPLRSDMQIGRNEIALICFDFNTKGCKKKECKMLHVCRAPLCKYAAHKYSAELCRFGRPLFDDVSCKRPAAKPSPIRRACSTI